MKLQLLEKLIEMLVNQDQTSSAKEPVPVHPMLGRRCLVRTYSAGVHIGTIDYVNPQNSMELRLIDAIRLWSWREGGLSLSAVANQGIKSGRLNVTGEIFLTNVIEIIPTTQQAEKSYVKFIEQ